MSTQPQTLSPAPAGAPRPPTRRAGGTTGGTLGRKWHGLPVWAWVVGGTVVAVLVYTKVLHKSSTTAAPATAPSGAVGSGSPTTAGGGTVTEKFPTGGGYTGPASSAPPYPKSLGTAPAPTSSSTPKPTTTAAKTTQPAVAGTFQGAMTGGTPHAFGGKVFSTIYTWAKTLSLAGSGTQVYLWTAKNQQPYPVSLAQLKQIEHTGTHKFPQFTTYTATTAKASASSTNALPKWTPGGQIMKPVPSSGTGTMTLTKRHQTGAAFTQTTRYTPTVKRQVIVSG